MRSRTIEFGVRELPRSKNDGYFFYRFSADSDERVLEYLDLYNPQEDVLSEVFRKGLLKLAKRENISPEGLMLLLSGYRVTNMEPWTAEILDRVIGTMVSPKG